MDLLVVGFSPLDEDEQNAGLPGGFDLVLRNTFVSVPLTRDEQNAGLAA